MPAKTVPDIVLPAGDEQPDSHHGAPAAAVGHGAHKDAEHEHHHEGASHHHGKKHRKHGHGEHGGHGDKWLVTYCDMITLLIAFFICILTFASKENGNKSHARLRDSLIYGPGGSGAIGSKEANADSVVWRQVLASVSPESIGSSSAPRHSDPQMHANEQVLDLLNNSEETVLDDNFSFRVPLVLLMTDAKTFSPSGRRLLGNIAFGLRQFAFDLIIQIEDPDVFPIAFRLSKHLTELAGCPPSRTGVSMLEGGTRQRDSIRFLFMARQR